MSDFLCCPNNTAAIKQMPSIRKNSGNARNALMGRNTMPMLPNIIVSTAPIPANAPPMISKTF